MADFFTKLGTTATLVDSQTAGGMQFTNFSLDASTDAIEWIFRAQEAATITHLGYRYGARTGTPPTYKISIQGVTNGRADGTIKGGGSPASKTFTPPADATINGLWQWQALDNSYTTAIGELLAIVIKYDSGTVDGSNFSSFTSRSSFITSMIFPYTVEVNGGSASNVTTCPNFGYKSASKTYGFPFEDRSFSAFDSNDAIDEKALRFIVPGGVGDTFKVLGAGIHWVPGITATTVKVILYDGTTSIQEVTLDCDDFGVVGGSTLRYSEIFFDEASLDTLTCGNVYRIGVQPQETTTATILQHVAVDSNAELSALPGGIEWYYSTRADAGAWTDVTNQRPCIAPIIMDLTEPTGSGGTTAYTFS